MISTEQELRHNLTIMRDRNGNGDMTPEAFKDAIAKIGLFQEQAGIFFGKYARRGQAWATGEKPVPLLIQRCLEFMVANGLTAVGVAGAHEFRVNKEPSAGESLPAESSAAEGAHVPVSNSAAEGARALGDRIADARGLLGINASELARRMGISRAAVAQWETGQTVPSAGNLLKLADVLGVTLNWLGQGTGVPLALPMGGNAAGFSEGEPVELGRLKPDLSRYLSGKMEGLTKAEIWRLNSGNMSGGGYQRGDYVVVDLAREAKKFDVVMAQHGQFHLFRLFSPPYLYCLPIGVSQAPLVVDSNVIVRGVVVSRLSITE
jgi:transcriptional regulator with XRE-family HTH domain